ncbi:MAG TPA: dihydrolipoyl dehydrogenase [Chloroflexi bacterium]|nr:dihydrolipoyl dehydrogenase [Chloroflexota bacterium]
MPSEYDVVILGAGPGGYVCAIRAAQLGLKVAIVEKKYWGGVCLNVGCIPSKALLRNAELAHIVRHRAKEFGFSFENLEVDYQVAFKRSRQVSGRLVKGVGFLMKKNKIDTYEGWGTIRDANTLTVALNDGGEETLTFRNLVIATGAHPRTIPGIELDKDDVIVSYLPAILSDSVPQQVVVVGAGPIGLEFSYIWASYGADVTIVEMLDRLAPLEDPDISAELEKAYKRLKIKFMTGTRVEAVERTGAGAAVKVSGPDGEQTLEAEKVLVAIGFAPNVEGFGLENLGVRLTERGGFIEIDEHMRTNVPNVYAIGDVTGKLMLAHVGSAMGIVAAETIAGHETVELDYRMMPRCTYCQPQIASFGYTEEQAREAGYEVSVARFPFQANGKALGLGESLGFVKLVTDARYGEILGAHMIGPDVTELLPEYTLAHNAELTAEEIARNVHAHPTLSEVLMEAAHGLVGGYIHI